MDSSLWDLELRGIDPLSRRQLLEAIRRRLDCVPPDLLERLDEQPDGWLRLLLMAARLNYALRQLRAPHWPDVAPPAGA
jgi:hypothetical protein